MPNREPIASTLDPLTEAQVNAYRRLPGPFGDMLQACYNDGWNGCHTHMKEEIMRLDARVAELEALTIRAYEALGSAGWQRGDDRLMDDLHSTLNLPE
jgi:hypothetical protein